MTPPSAQDVAAAAARLAGHAHRTPVLRSRQLDARVGAEVVFKAEHLQRTGSFKFRGAYHALARLTADARRAGVVAFSSGNHAQAVALAARLFDAPATIVMPHDAPAIKVAATVGYGATIVRYDRHREDREAIGAALARDRGLSLIPPFDHPDVIAGQGTATRELLEDAGPLDALFVPMGGGGLVSGAVLAAEALAPACRVYAVEPAAGDDGRRSLAAGARIQIATPDTIADGAQTQMIGALPFAILGRRLAGVVTATDAQLAAAMAVIAERMKQVVEPTGALGLAGALHGGAELAGRRVGVVLSGGNVDLPRFAALIGGA